VIYWTKDIGVHESFLTIAEHNNPHFCLTPASLMKKWHACIAVGYTYLRIPQMLTFSRTTLYAGTDNGDIRAPWVFVAAL
jgi:hypothetical protein